MSNSIMIVDDASFMRIILKDILNEAGFSKIIEATSGNEALQLAKSQTPDIVILDVTMPDIDGIEVLTKIKNQSPETKVIMCSSLGQEDMVKECFEKGADDFIMKPFKPERIIHSINKFI